VDCAYFVSDIHLSGSPDDPRHQGFLAFLRALRLNSASDAGPFSVPLKKPTHLFLLGDIFDLWVGSHRHFQEKFSDIIAEITGLVREGVEVHFFEGNHDFHLREFWEKQLGVKVHPSVAYFELAGKTVRIEHGDLINLDDRNYLRLRWFFRTPVMEFLAHNLPSKLISAIGEMASHTSRSHSRRSRSSLEDSIRAMIMTHAKRAIRERPFDLIVAGHVHLVDDVEVPPVLAGGPLSRSVNLGSWFDGPKAFFLSSEVSGFVPVAHEDSRGLARGP
jgi:UDP-2,3-diacylglucosamine hydrolase